MKSLTFNINGEKFTTDKRFVLDAATVKTENGKTLVNFAKNDVIAGNLIQRGLKPVNDNPRKILLNKDYWFEVKVEN